ncbi:MAG TPA: hypothetical protein VFS21_32330 [Roseiflexaceae bacterium]|nr:hypothetical protein [Roseiflexaceae bacterium]
MQLRLRRSLSALAIAGPRRALALGLGLALALGVAGTHLLLYAPYTADDAFISFRYARNFALGNGLVFNPGERVEGYSTFSWVVLLGLLNRAGLDIALTAKLLNGAIALATVLLTGLLGRHLVAQPPDTADTPAFFAGLPWAALLLAGDAAFGYWSANGMEMPLVALLLLAGGALHLRELERGGPPLSALVFGALALTRPEGAFFGGLTLLHRLAAGGDPASLPAALHPVAIARRLWDQRGWIGLFLLVLAPFLLWRYSYYGQWVPNTVVVKTGPSLRSLLEGGLTVYLFVSARAAVLLLVGLGLLATRRWWAKPWMGYAVLLLLGNGVFVTLAGGDWMPLDRFWVLMLPWLYLLASAAPPTLAQQWGPTARRWHGALPALLLALGLAGSLMTRLTTNTPSINNASPAASRWLREVARPGDVVATTNIGAVGYYNMDLVILDMIGLTDAHIARTPARFPGGLLASGNGFGHWDTDYVLARRPRFVEMAGVTREQAEQWAGRPAWVGAAELYQRPEFRQQYQYGDMSFFVLK